jgi:hypothetical protein
LCQLGVSATADLGLGAQSSFLRRRQYLSEVAEIRPLVEAIVDEQLGPERIAAVFKLSACKTAKADCAFVLLVGSVSRYRGSPGNWSSEPEDGLCSTLVGGDFALVSDQATKFVAKHWLAISSLAHGAEAPEGGHRGDTFCLVSDLQRGESARPGRREGATLLPLYGPMQRNQTITVRRLSRVPRQLGFVATTYRRKLFIGFASMLCCLYGAGAIHTSA